MQRITDGTRTPALSLTSKSRKIPFFCIKDMGVKPREFSFDYLRHKICIQKKLGVFDKDKPRSTVKNLELRPEWRLLVRISHVAPRYTLLYQNQHNVENRLYKFMYVELRVSLHNLRDTLSRRYRL